LLCVVCVVLIAAGSTSCRLGDGREQPTQKTPDSGSAVDVRQTPVSKALLSKRPAKPSAAGSDQVGICDPGASPVMIVVVESPQKVKSASALWKTTPIVVQEAETVVFADGRIVTSRLEATGDHLQSLGWTHRKIEIVGGLPAAAGAWQRRRG